MGDQLAVRRRAPVVARHVTAGGGQGVGVDQQPVRPRDALAHIEFEGVGADRPQLGEEVRSGGLKGADRGQGAGHRLDLGGQGVAAGDFGQDLRA